ncbi:hypothetical protein [Labilibacter marinus]|uniref:hypothetical protein n=1 Tax=Labilibacter marinus TaxID=1477105 RepID=UPI000836B061|nr:hypothetical protein [Labilibacter marinus]
MKKTTYIFICFLLSTCFWNLSFITRFLNLNSIHFLTWTWCFCAFLFFKRRIIFKEIYRKYYQYVFWIFLGVFISMFSAYFFWKQDFVQTFKVQKGIYSFVLLLALYYVQPSEKDIITGLEWISILTIIIWIIVAVNPNLISIKEEVIEFESNTSKSDFGYNVHGIHFVVMLFYYKTQKYIEKFTWKYFTVAMLLLGFVFLFQNRSMLLGIFPILIYSLIKLKSKQKSLIIVSIVGFLTSFIIFSKSRWTLLLEQSQNELVDTDYNRWKSFYYYINDHSPNLFCNIFGNGVATIESDYGIYTNSLEGNGIFISDLGMIGMWSDFGVIPIILIYSVLINILFKRKYPLYLKFISLHVLLIPTIFHFWSNPGIFFFVIILYLFSYHKELPKYSKLKESIKTFE